MTDQHRRARDGARDESGTEAWLGGLLEHAAAEYEPDTERLRARVDARIGAPPEGAAARRGRRAARGPRRLALLGRLGLAGIPAGVALATIGGAAALAVGATATIAVTSNHNETTTVSVLTPHGGGSGGPSASQGTSTSPGAQPSGTGSSAPASQGSHSSPGGSASGSATTSATGTGGTNALFSVSALVDPGGNPDWSQLDVRIAAKQPLNSVTIRITVAACAGLASTGQFNTADSGTFTESETTNPNGSLTYTFTLDAGSTFAAKAQGPEFAAQFNHAGTGWNAALDTFSVDARTAGSAADTVIQGAY